LVQLEVLAALGDDVTMARETFFHSGKPSLDVYINPHVQSSLYETGNTEDSPIQDFFIVRSRSAALS
jgi:hypothetical protein